jgi:anhydro-N-acetylmuramic acid kinase
MQNQSYTAIGLMSGTSMDGVDAALVRTDGQHSLEMGTTHYIAYPSEFKRRLASILGGKGDVKTVEQELTDYHIRAVKELLTKAGGLSGPIDYIGFHGHTILHDPKNKKTWQIGDAARLAKETGIDVVYDFRTNDVAQGGQGAPLVPLFHKTCAEHFKWQEPVAILNLGGVANITYIDGENIMAFDTGPANALINDWIYKKTGDTFDAEGKQAKQGKVDMMLLAQLMGDAFFTLPPPKSLDRDHFKELLIEGIEHLSLADGAATLTAFTVESVVAACAHLPHTPVLWALTGGGRHNKFLYESLKRGLQATSPQTQVKNIDDLGMDGDFMEAQAFGYLAVRSILGLPLSLPTTTGVKSPTTGGKRIKA